MRSIRLFLLVSFLACVVMPSQLEAGEKASQKVTLFKEWRFLNGPQEEVVRFNAKSFYSWLGGPDLPQQGISMEKKIAEVIPGPTSTSGKVIIGPDKESYRPYWVIHWSDLSARGVKLAFPKKTYATPEEAKKSDQPDPSRIKSYRALTWGIY